MGILDAPVRALHPIQTITGYGHSFTVITVNHPSTTISTAVAVGATTLTLASAATIQRYHRYTIRDAASYQNPEEVTVIDVNTTTNVVTLASPITTARASTGALFIDPSFNLMQRFAKMAGDPSQFTNRGIGGGVLIRGGSTTAQGGFNTVMRLHPVPPGVGDPSPGLNLCVWGTNDLGTINGTTVTSLALQEACRHTARAVQARFNLTKLFEAETPFPDGAILTNFNPQVTASTGTTQNSGTGWRTIGAGGVITHSLAATTDATLPRYVDFCFLAGGGLAGGQINFAVDGVPVYPVGGTASAVGGAVTAFSAANPFSTAASITPPIASATAIPCVARIRINDLNAHSITATCVSGAALDWIGYEADYPSPSIWTNICVTPGIYDGNGSRPYAQMLPDIQGWNTMLQQVVDEFASTHLAVVDMYTALSPGAVPIARAWTKALDFTHPNTFGNGLVAQAMYRAYSGLALSDACIANL
jgi:hypothetical protein